MMNHSGVQTFLVLAASYALGCFAAGYYLVRWRLGKDIRESGSGSVGARNVGRVLGPAGFAATFLLDFSKGALATLLANSLGLNPWGVVAVMVAVVAGHIWPAHLGFRGGKGIATSLGVVTAQDWRITIILLFMFAVSLALTRRYTLSGVGAVVLSPLVALVLQCPTEVLYGIMVLIVLILIAHRSNLRDLQSGSMDEETGKSRTGDMVT